MDPFAAIVVGGLALGFGLLVLLGWSSTSRQVADITDKGRNRAIGAQAEIEERDVGQMVDAANTYRRKVGRQPLTVADIEARVAAEQRAALSEAQQDGRSSPRRTQTPRVDGQ